MNNQQLNLINTLVISVFRTNRSLIAFGEKLAGRHKLTTARWKVLGAITLAETPLSVPQIARTMDLTRQAVQRIIDQLQQQDILVECDNPDNKRSPLFGLTAKGQKLYAAVNADWEKIISTFANRFDLAELDTTVSNLDTFLKLIDKAFDPEKGAS